MTTNEFELLGKAIEEVSGIKKEMLFSKKRTRTLVELRMMCSNIIKENNLKLSVEKIGLMLNINHSTVTYHIKTHRNLLTQKDGKYKDMYEKINSQFLTYIMLSYNHIKNMLFDKKNKLEKMLQEVNLLIETLEIQEKKELELKVDY